jgi:hypothetical protein
MSFSSRTRRSLGVLAVSLIGTTLVATPALAGPADDPAPIPPHYASQGNPTDECALFGLGVIGKYDAEPAAGATLAVPGTSITIVGGAETGVLASWSSPTPVGAVLVKAGTVFHHYAGGTSGTDLNTVANKNGGYKAISHVTFCGTPATPSGETDPPPPPPAPLTLAVDASGSYTKTFLWSIDKSVDRPWIARSGDTAPLHYDVATVNTGYALSAITVGGTVTVTNPNAVARPLADLVVTPDLGSCAVTAPATVAPGATELSFTCVVSTTDETALTSLDVAASALTVAPASDAVAWDVTKVNEQVTVTDAYDGGAAELLAATSYDRSAATPATLGCRSVSNTATIVETGQTDSTTSTVCRQFVTAGGFTIGFWGNKNGQARIAQNAAAICAALGAYTNVLTVPATCNSVTLPVWVKSVLDAATSKGDGITMFRAQFLATALNVTTDTVNHLGETDVVVNPALLGSACMSVSQVLAAGNATLPTASTNKTWVTGVKDLYDAVNNNRLAVCA